MSSPNRRLGRSATRPLVIVLTAIAALYFGREILIPLAFACTLSFLLTAPVSGLQKIGLGRLPAVALVVAFALSAAAGAGWIVGTQLLEIAKDLPLYRSNIHNKLESIRTNKKGSLARAASSLNEIQKEIEGPAEPVPPAPQRPTRAGGAAREKTPTEVHVVQQPRDYLEYLYGLINPFLRILGSVGIVVIFSIFILVNREDLRNRMLRLVGLSQMNLVTQAFDDATRRVTRYLRMQFIVNAGFAALISAGLFAIGVPSPVLWGVVAGICRLIPYVGIMIATVLPLALSLAVFEGWLHPLLVFGLFAVAEVIVANFVEPYLYGAHTGISPLALLVTTIFWAVLWGPAGLVLSTPLTVCVIVLGRYVPQLSFLHILLGDEPVLSPEAQLFQRLLAMDQQEAREVVEAFVKEKPLLDLYDGLFLPALSMAEQDRHKGSLDQDREDFIFLSINEMVAEFANYRMETETPVAPLGVSCEARGRVFCLAAGDRADEIAASMFAQLLEHAGRGVMCFPATASLDLLANGLELDSDDVLCVSALPPFAFASARATYQRLRRRFPDAKIIIGMWGFNGDAEKMKNSFERDQPEAILTSLSQALAHCCDPAAQFDPDAIDLRPAS